MNTQAAPARILVVDDNAQNRALATATLEDEGYAVNLAVDGAEAIASFERTPPDCVLLDVRMPGVDARQCVSASERCRSGAMCRSCS